MPPQMNRRNILANIAGMIGAAALWTPPDAFALGLPSDKIKRIRYYVTPTDAAGRANDFASTDRKFALNVDLQFYTPEVSATLPADATTSSRVIGILPQDTSSAT